MTRNGAHLVWVLHDEVFSLFQLHTDVDDAAKDAPRILHVQVDLLSKLGWLELLHAQDHVLRRVEDVLTWHIAETHATWYMYWGVRLGTRVISGNLVYSMKQTFTITTQTVASVMFYIFLHFKGCVRLCEFFCSLKYQYQKTYQQIKLLLNINSTNLLQFTTSANSFMT